MRFTVRAHAKINWSLAICGERSDGYHDLDMLMQTIELSDEITFESARLLTLEMDGRREKDPGRNLVIRAGQALNDLTGRRLGARIRLKKNIPARAGLGGGSADCAAALLALNRLWNLRLPVRTLMRVGLKLGADVPFCLQQGLCRAQGVGEILTPAAKAPSYPLVLVTPGGGLSTPAVFKAWNAGGYALSPLDNALLEQALQSGDLRAAQALSRNDLEAPAVALMPEIQRYMDQFRALGAPFVRMSGSGSTVFAAFDDEGAARLAASSVPGAIFTRSCGAQSVK